MDRNIVYTKWVLKNRWKVIFTSLVFFLLAVSGGRYLKFNNDGRMFFNQNDPNVIALNEIENSYTRNDNIFIGLKPKDGNVFTREFLSSVEELTKMSWQVPFSSRVESLTNFQHTWANDDELIVENLVSNAKSLTDKDLLRVKKIAFSDPVLLNRFISENGDLVGINITILKAGESDNETSMIMKFLRDMVNEFESENPNIDAYISGSVPFDNAFGEVSMDDMSTLVPGMYVLMIVLIWILLRAFSGALSTLIIIVVSTLTAMGITGWLGIYLTPASASAPTIIITLSIADSIHILSTMYYEMRHGKSKFDAILESMRVNLQPVFLTSITTAIGFLSMNASDAKPFRDLGNIVAIGVTTAFAFSVFLLPAILSVLPIRVKVKAKESSELIDKFGNFVVEKRKPLFWGMLLTTLFLVAGIARINLNDRFVDYFDKKYKIRSDTDFMVENNLSGSDLIEYSIPADGSNGIVSPVYLKNLEKFTSWYKNQPSVVYVGSFTSVMKRLNKSMHGDDPAYYKIPEDRSLAAQFLLLYEMSLPFGLDLNNQVNIDKSASRFIVITKKTSTKELRELDIRASAWMKGNLPDYMLAYGSGVSVIWSHISKRNINTMLNGTIIALILISAILIWALKSFKYGLISLIPNITPALMAFGFWGYLEGEVGLAVSVVGAMSLGIVVDDTIHFLTKYLRAKKELNLDSKEAVKKSFHIVGSAIITTTVVLVAGFMVLTFSGFLLNSAMGLLTAIALAFALLADSLFLPPLLMKIDEYSDSKKNENISLLNEVEETN